MACQPSAQNRPSGTERSIANRPKIGPVAQKWLKSKTCKIVIQLYLYENLLKK